MKAPDKIYILTLDNGARFVESVKIKDDCDEYIRKDALLEWAKEMRDEAASPFVASLDKNAPTVVQLVDCLINHINSL